MNEMQQEIMDITKEADKTKLEVVGDPGSLTDREIRKQEIKLKN